MFIFFDNILRFKKYYYAFYHSRVTNDPDAFLGFSGLPRNISRLGFNSFETEYSGLGFENNWSTLQYGRGRQAWGSGNDLFLSSSINSPPYDYGLIGIKLGKIKMRYFHGFLESVGHNKKINRYILGRGIEWSNSKNLLIGINEIVVYQGENRPIDLTMLNPISNHIEIEINNRQNMQGNYQNAIWQLSVDSFLNSRFRFSFNYAIDELTIDQVEKDIDETNLTAFSSKLVYKVYDNKYGKILSSFKYIKIGTHTFRHAYGMNNFVTRHSPIGNSFGSDILLYEFGLDFFDNDKIFINTKFGYREEGENTILIDPYDSNEDIIKEPFPSGNIKEVLFGVLNFEKWFNSNNAISLSIGLDKNNEDLNGYVRLGLFFSLNNNINYFF